MKFKPIKIKVDEEETRRLRFERGKKDAELGFPPTDPSIEYLNGYYQNRKQGTPCNWKGTK